MKSIPQVTGFRIASPVVSGILWAIIWLAAGTLLVSIMLYGSSLGENEIVPWVFGVHGFASLCGGFVSARRSGKRGWYVGFATGLLYALLVLAASYLASDIGWTPRILSMLGLCCAAGAFGGMFGVNTGSASKRR
ncbi:TIGR04086 family membrane protein [Cohnella fermenti]|uniref:TIGR04086 family membrane protein n=1 Tax=Cohnella fermenti TaxID=2565925 RepID=A0A4S4C7B1_9BACL|nr:TIGR04086 family membrane protein [Cohnella fermenti]THF83827.1 TIGR04086 family membrane protein [Cohnella fermenti]